MAPLKQVLWHVRSSLKVADAFSFAPAPRFAGGSSSTALGLAGTAVLWGLFIWYVVVSLAGFFGNTPPTARRTVPVSTEVFSMPPLGLTFRRNVDGRPLDISHDDRHFRVYFEQVTGYEQDLMPRVPTPIATTTCDLSAWAGWVGRQALCPAEQAYISGGYTSPEYTYFAAHIVTCTPESPYQWPNGTNVTCAPEAETEALLEDGEFSLLLNPRTTDEESHIEVHRTYFDPGAHTLSESIYHKRTVVEPPSYVWSWATHRVSVLRLSSDKAQFIQRTLRPLTAGGGRSAITYYARMDSFEIEETRLQPNLLWLSGAWSAFYVTIYNAFAMGLLWYAARRFYERLPRWSGLGLRPFKAKKTVAAVESLTAPTTVSEHRAVRAWRYHLIGALVFFLEVAVILACFIAKSAHEAGVINVDPSVDVIAVRQCAVDLACGETNVPKPFSTAFRYVTRIDAGDSADGKTRLVVDGTDSQNCQVSLCMGYDALTAAERVLEFTVEGALLDLRLRDLAAFERPVRVSGVRGVASKLWIRSPALDSFNASLPTGVIMVAPRVRSGRYNLTVGYGPLVIAPTTSASGAFEATVVVPSPAAYCVNSDIRLTTTEVSREEVDLSSGNITVVNETIVRTSAGIMRASALTVVGSASSVYVVRAAESDRISSPAMTTPTNVILDPDAAQTLNDTDAWLASSNLNDYAQVVEVVTPGLGLMLVNTDRRLILEFSPATLGMLTGFVLKPLYRRVLTTASHFQCRVNGSLADLFPDDALLTTVANAEHLQVNELYRMLDQFLPLQVMYTIFNDVQGTATGFTGVDSPAERHGGRPDHFKTFNDHFDSYELIPVRMPFLVKFLIGLTVSIAVVIIAGIVAIAFLKRIAIADAMLLRSAREKTVRTYSLELAAPVALYASMAQAAQLAAFHIVRNADSFFFGNRASFARFIRTHLQPASHTADALSLAELLEMYGSHCLSHFTVAQVPTVAMATEVITAAGGSVADRKVAIASGVAAIADVNCARQMPIVCGGLYVVTGKPTDVVPVSHIANELGINASTVTEELETAAGVKIMHQSVLMVLDLEPRVDQRRIPFLHFEGLRKQAADLDVCMWSVPLYSIASIPTRTTQRTRLDWLRAAALWLGQALVTIFVYRMPAIIALGIVAAYDSENSKYAASTNAIPLSQFDDVVLPTHGDHGGGALKPFTFPAANAVFYLFLAFYVASIVEIAAVTGLRFLKRAELISPGFEFAIRLIPTAGVAILYGCFVVFDVGYLLSVLMWWVLGAIISPGAMLAFCSAALALIAGLVGAYSSLQNNKKAVVSQMKQRALEELIKLLKASSASIGSAELGDTLSSAASADVDGDDVNNGDVEISSGLLLDIAGGEEAAIAQLSGLLHVPPVIVRIAVAAAKKDASKVDRCVKDVLELICLDPALYGKLASCIILRGLSVPVPSVDVVRGVMPLVERATQEVAGGGKSEEKSLIAVVRDNEIAVANFAELVLFQPRSDGGIDQRKLVSGVLGLLASQLEPAFRDFGFTRQTLSHLRDFAVAAGDDNPAGACASLDAAMMSVDLDVLMSHVDHAWFSPAVATQLRLVVHEVARRNSASSGGGGGGGGGGHIDAVVIDLLKMVLADVGRRASARFNTAIGAVQELLDTASSTHDTAHDHAADANVGGVIAAAAADLRLINAVRCTPTDQWPAVRQFYVVAFGVLQGSVGDQLEVVLQRTTALTNTERTDIRKYRIHFEASEILRRAERADVPWGAGGESDDLPDLFAAWIALQWVHLHGFVGAPWTEKQQLALDRLTPLALRFARHLGMADGLGFFAALVDLVKHAHVLIRAGGATSDAAITAAGPALVALFASWDPIRSLVPIPALTPVAPSLRHAAGLPNACHAVASLHGIDLSTVVPSHRVLKGFRSIPATVKDIVACEPLLTAAAVTLHSTLEYQLTAPFAQVIPKELTAAASASGMGAHGPLIKMLVAAAIPNVTALIGARATPSKNWTARRMREATIGLLSSCVPDVETNTASHHLLDAFQALARRHLGGKPGNDLDSRLRDLPVTVAQLDMLFDATRLVSESPIAQLVVAAVSDQHLRSTEMLVKLREQVTAPPKGRRDAAAEELLDVLISDWRRHRAHGGSSTAAEPPELNDTSRWRRLLAAARGSKDSEFDAALRACIDAVPSNSRLLVDAIARALHPGALAPTSLALLQRRLVEGGFPRIVLDMSIALLRVACGRPASNASQYPPMAASFDSRATAEQRLFERREAAIALSRAAYHSDYQSLRCYMETLIDTLTRQEASLAPALAPTQRFLRDVELDVVPADSHGATRPASARLARLFAHPLEHLLRIVGAGAPAGGVGVPLADEAAASSDEEADDDHSSEQDDDEPDTTAGGGDAPSAPPPPKTGVERMMMGTGGGDDLEEPLMTEMAVMSPIAAQPADEPAYVPPAEEPRRDTSAQQQPKQKKEPKQKKSRPAPRHTTTSAVLVEDSAGLGLLAALVRDNHTDATAHLRTGMAALGGEPLETAVVTVARLLQRIATPGPVDVVEWLDAALDIIRFVVVRLLPMAVQRGQQLAAQAEAAAAAAADVAAAAASAVEQTVTDAAAAGESLAEGDVSAAAEVATGEKREEHEAAATAAAQSLASAPSLPTAGRARSGTTRRTGEIEAFVKLLNLVQSALHGVWPRSDAGGGAIAGLLDLIASRKPAGVDSAAFDRVAGHVPPVVTVLIEGVRDPFTKPIEICLRLLEHIAVLILGAGPVDDVKALTNAVRGVIEKPSGKAKRDAALQLVLSAVVEGSSSSGGDDGGAVHQLPILVAFASGDLTKLPAVLEMCGVPADPAADRVVAALGLLQQFAADRTLTASAAAGVAKEAFVDAFVSHVFHQFDVEGRGRIDFNSFAAVLRRAHVDLPQADQRALFAEADADGSGFIDKREFRQALELMQETFMRRALETLGLTDAQIATAVALLALYVVLFLVFILVGIVTFTDGSQFTTVITGGMPMLSTGLRKLTSPESLQQLLQLGDKAVTLVFDRMQQRVGV